jgi:putative ABC transport system permease protein
MSVGISAGQVNMTEIHKDSNFQATLMGSFFDSAFPLQGKTALSKDTLSSDLGFNLSDYTDEVTRVDIFIANQSEIKDYDKLLETGKSSLSPVDKANWNSQSSDFKDSISNHLHVIALSQYNALRSHLGLPALVIAPGHACLYRDPNFYDANPVVDYLLGSNIELDYKNAKFLIDPQIESIPLSADHAITLSFGLIVPDEDISTIIPKTANTNTLINFDFKPEIVQKQGLESALSRLNESVQLSNSPVKIFSVLQVQAREIVTTVSMSYICIYMGLIFLMCSSALLAIQQLTNLEENRQSFLILSKLGATQKQLRQSVIRQVSSYFALPLGLAIIDSVVGFFAINPYIQMKTSLSNLGIQSLYIGIFLVCVYGIYYLLTCMSAIKAVERYTVIKHNNN